MLYQILRVAVCAVLLASSTVNAVGKRALWNFVEAKKELQKKLIELRKLDSTADVDKSVKLAEEIKGHLDEVRKVDPTKAAEFLEVLDASFEQESAELSLVADKAKKKVKKEIETKAEKIKEQGQKVVDSVKTSTNSAVQAAAKSGALDYLSYVMVPVSWTAYPFTALINKSYKMSVRLLDWVTMNKVSAIHERYLKILEDEKEALAAIIVNTSLVAALKINGFLDQVSSSIGKPVDLTHELLPVAKYRFLGKMYDKAKGIITGQRTKETFSGSRLHTIVMGELLEYGALLTPIVDLEKYDALQNQLSFMSEHIYGIFKGFFEKGRNAGGIISNDEINLFCSVYELYLVLNSANEESKKIKDPVTDEIMYPNGKLNHYFGFTDKHESLQRTASGFLNAAKIDPSSMLDTRSFMQKSRDMIAKKGSKIVAYQEEFAAIAGLALTIAGGSYLVQSYFPDRFKNQYSEYVVASMNTLISVASAYAKSAAGAVKKQADSAVALIRSRVSQLPYSDKILKPFTTTYAKAVGIIGSASAMGIKLLTKVRGAGEVVQAQAQEFDTNFDQPDLTAEELRQMNEDVLGARQVLEDDFRLEDVDNQAIELTSGFNVPVDLDEED